MMHYRSTTLAQRLLLISIAAPLLLGLAACTELNRFLARPEGKPAGQAPQAAQQTPPETTPAPQEKPKPGRLYEWSGDGRRVSHIVVNTDEQKARFYDGDEQIGWTTVASGVSKFPTPTGQFEVMEKVANKRSNLYGKIYGAGGKVVRSDAKAGRDPIPAGARFEGAHMPYFLRLTNDGIGLHAGPIPRPGRPASHGCIRMPSKFAPVLFKHVDPGTKVSIVGSGPSYGNYVQKQRALAARERERREEAARAQAAATTVSAATGDQVGSPTTAAVAQPVAQSADRLELPAGVQQSGEQASTTGAEIRTVPQAAQAPMAPTPAPEAADPTAPSATEAKMPQPSAASSVAQSAAPEPISTPPAPTDPVPPPSAASPPLDPAPMQPAAATVPAPSAEPAPAASAPEAPAAPPVSAE